ncbi:cupin domain-containing protein [Opitutales bacterium]|nr:cupin domain-containing protein [Opitutales bacterium]
MKLTAVIPVLLGSSRIPDKNILMVNGYPLAFYVAKACKDSGIFDEIYLNSEDKIFEKFADQLNINFYHRNSHNGGSKCTMKNVSMDCNGRRCQVHDHFLADFMESISTDYVVQVHSTSPLIKPETIVGFTKLLIDNENDGVFAIEEIYSECLIDEKPLNFTLDKKTKTQDLIPVQKISWALSGWKRKSFLESYYDIENSNKSPTFKGKIAFYPINHIEALDADTWDELFIIEACLNHLKRAQSVGKFKYDQNIKEIDHELIRLIMRDGVEKFEDTSGFNKPHMKIESIKEKMKDQGASWCHPVVYTENDQCCLISQAPGEGCRTHYHTTKDEWWYIVEGEFEWRLGDGRILKAKSGEIIFLECGTVHTIICVSKENGIRLACGGRDMEHIYV